MHGGDIAHAAEDADACLVRAGRGADAAPVLDEALTFYLRTGAHRGSARMEAGLRALGVRRRPGQLRVATHLASVFRKLGITNRAAALAESLTPEAHVNRSGQAAYWADYGRALARIRGRRNDAVMALRRAELISPHRIQRGPVVREVLAELLAHSKRDAIGRELRGMAYRAGLPLTRFGWCCRTATVGARRSGTVTG